MKQTFLSIVGGSLKTSTTSPKVSDAIQQQLKQRNAAKARSSPNILQFVSRQNSIQRSFPLRQPTIPSVSQQECHTPIFEETSCSDDPYIPEMDIPELSQITQTVSLSNGSISELSEPLSRQVPLTTTVSHPSYASTFWRMAYCGQEVEMRDTLRQVLSMPNPNQCANRPLVMPILPPQPSHLAGCLTLVLDLDQTLYSVSTTPPLGAVVIAQEDLIGPPDTTQAVCVRTTVPSIDDAFVALRPGVVEFLKWASKRFEIIAYTAAEARWADAALACLDPLYELLPVRLYRPNATFFPEYGFYRKDIQLLGREAIIAVDDSPLNFYHCLDQYVPCPLFKPRVRGDTDQTWSSSVFTGFEDNFMAQLRAFLEPLQGTCSASQVAEAIHRSCAPADVLREVIDDTRYAYRGISHRNTHAASLVTLNSM